MMTKEELIALSDQLIQEWLNDPTFPLQPDEPGLSGPLGDDVFLPKETVDAMEAAINEAFEQVSEQVEHNADVAE